MKQLKFNIFVIAFVAIGVANVHGGPAQFWLSASGTFTSGPEVPTIPGITGGVSYLYIWGRPGTDDFGTLRQLQNVSLTIVASNSGSGIDFVDGTYTVYNQMTPKRFEYVSDSTSNVGGFQAPLVSYRIGSYISDGLPNLSQGDEMLVGLQGLTIFSPSTLGIGPSNLNESFSTNNGPAWLIGRVGYTVLPSTQDVSVYLRIGPTGMSYVNSPSAQTDVIFGNDVNGVFNAGNENDRCDSDVCKVAGYGNALDALIATTLPALHGDYDGDGVIGPNDFKVWRSQYGQLVPPGSAADGNGDGKIDSADYVLWRKHLGSQAGSGLSRQSVATQMVPEPNCIGLAFLSCVVASFLIRFRR